MPLRKAFPVRFTYRGLSDAADSTDVFLGASQQLSNWLFDRDNPEWIVPIPGVTALTSFAGFNTPGFVSLHNTVKPLIYGMIGTARNVGKDEPFVYDNAASAFNAVAGVQATNVPTSPATSGAWTPPTLAPVGSRVIFTHPGFTGAGGLFFGFLDTSSFALATVGTTAIGSPIITAVGSTVGVALGQTIAGAGIPANSWVIGFTVNTITINVNCTANGAGVALAIAGGTPAAPLWGAGNTTTVALPGVPKCVSNFNNRAYYAVGNTLYWSDNLAPTNISNANQNQVVGDGSDIIALYGASVQTSSGGVTSALFIFKANGQIWQFVGDQALANTALAFVSLTIGTNAPRSIVGCDEGIYFAATDGPKLIDLNSALRDITHGDRSVSSDISAPFRNAITPSRIAAAFCSSVYRVTMDTVVKGQSLFAQDYWFDTRRRRWNGPHTFAWDCASPYDTYFIVSGAGTPGVLFKSQAYPDVNTVYTNNGANYNCTATSATMPKIEEMREKQMVEMTSELGYTPIANNNYQIYALDEQGSVLNQVAVSTYNPGSLWGGITWGLGVWGSNAPAPHTFDVPWDDTVIFQKIAIKHVVMAASGVCVGTQYMRYQNTGYTTTIP